jgi:hypothetical protein
MEIRLAVPAHRALHCLAGVALALGCGGGRVTAPTITVPPADQLVTVGETASFQVTASGTAPLRYQWRRDGTDIPGASGASYDTGFAGEADEGARFSVVVSNSAGSTTSTEAQLTVTPPPEPWAPISREHEQPDDYDSDVYRWVDASGQQRTAALTRTDAADPGGSCGGMLRQLRFFLPDGVERVASGAEKVGGVPGFGYVVSHVSGGTGSDAVLSYWVCGSYRSVFLGAHHAIHEFTWTLTPWEQTPLELPVKVTVQWFMATGRDHPIYAITYDTSAAPPGGLSPGQTIDSRSPYGELQFDGGANAYVDGVGWGDKYQFFTRDAPETFASRWDYTQPNVVPYVKLWVTDPDAEMGAVQTLSWLQHNTGGTWFHNNWGRTSETRVDAGDGEFTGPGDVAWMMPTSWDWPYQLNAWEFPYDVQPIRSKRLTWGLKPGAVGQAQYDGYGSEGKLSGHPYQSYSVHTVIGMHSSSDVARQVAEVEHQLASTLTVATGRPVVRGPGGVGRTDSVEYAVPGYNSIYGAYELQADPGGAFRLTLDLKEGSLLDPVFIVRGATGIPGRIVLDRTLLLADRGYFASYDAASSTLWLTIHRLWTGRRTLSGTP